MAFEFLDEFDVLAKWPSDQKGLLESKKWSDRVESLATLDQLIVDHPRLASNVSYSDLVTKLKMIVLKDMNVNVVSNAIKVITGLIKGLRHSFDNHANLLAPILFEKFKEQKEVVKAPLIVCTEALIEFCSIDKLPLAFDEALKKPHPSVKLQINLLIYKILTHYSPSTRPINFIKQIAQRIAKSTTEADATVRDGAFAALGAIVRLVGDKAAQTLCDGAQWNEEKIKENVEKANEDAQKWAEAHATEDSESATVEASDAPSSSQQETAEEAAEEMDPWDLLEPRNVIKDLPNIFDEYLVSKKWQERKEALEDFLKVIEKSPKLIPDIEIFRPFIGELKKIIEKDTNVNVVSLAVKSVTGLVHGLRSQFLPVLPQIFQALINKSKEKKDVFVDPFNKCLDEMASFIHLQHFSGLILAALSNQNPQTRRQYLLYVSRIFSRLNNKTAPKEQVKELAPKLADLTSDATPDVRDATYAAIGAIARCIGDQAAEQLFKEVLADSNKKPKIEEKQKAFEEEFGQKLDSNLAKIYSASTGPPPASAKAPPKPAVNKAKPTPSRPSSTARPVQPKPIPSAVRTNSSSNMVNSAPKLAPSRPVPIARPVQPKTIPSSVRTNSSSNMVNGAPKLAPSRPIPARPTSNARIIPARPIPNVVRTNSSSNMFNSTPKPAPSRPIPARPTSTVRPIPNVVRTNSSSNMVNSTSKPAPSRPISARPIPARPTSTARPIPNVVRTNSASKIATSKVLSQTRIDLAGAKPSRLRPPSNLARRSETQSSLAMNLN